MRNVAFPPSCAVCDADLGAAVGPARAATGADSAEADICSECLGELVAARPMCPRCGASTPWEAPAANGCSACRATRFRFFSVVRLGDYEGRLREVILRMKRHHEFALTLAIGRALARSRGAELHQLAADVVVPAPMHWTRRFHRGSNSPDVLAEAVGRALDLPVAPFLLSRVRRTKPQVDLPVSRRAANVRGAFRATRNPDLIGANVLLVDDVLTTGATCNEAARTLLRAGAARVCVAVAGRAT